MTALRVAALAALLTAAVACDRAPAPEAPAPSTEPRLAAGPHVTCRTGAAPACAGEDDFQTPTEPAVLADAAAADFGLRHGCLLDPSGGTACWGDGSRGQLGVEPSSLAERRRGRPVSPEARPVAGLPPLAALDAGWLHTCGVTASGAVWCWGDDALGQLGRAAAGPAALAIDGLEPAVAVAAGGFHSCSLSRGGAVACWGDGSLGQLGGDAEADAATPAAVAGLARPATAISAGGYHTCARLDDGAVTCWGDNRFGQLGDGTTTRRAAPVNVKGLSGPATTIVAGFAFTCALLDGGGVQCWGSDELGELGDGAAAAEAALTTVTSPRAVAGASGAVRLVAGGAHACAELGDGSFRCWGANEHGQLGDGTVEDRPRPVEWLGRAAQRPRPAIDLPDGALTGVDVSYHSGRVDWGAVVAAGHRFALTLATAGVDFRDPFLTNHWERMRQAGLVRGAYHFYVAGDDPEAQARHFLAHLELEPGDLAPVVDLETRGRSTGADLSAELRRFLAVIEPALGVRPILYTGPVFWQRNMTADFGDYPLWVAEYGVETPKVPPGWDRWHLWQWRGDVELPAIAPVVDLNRLHPGVALAELRLPGGR